MTRAAGAAVVLALAVPAMADQPILSPNQKLERIGRCIEQGGSRDRCVEMYDPHAPGWRALREYHLEGSRERTERERECWDDPTIINPRSCSEGRPPVYRRD